MTRTDRNRKALPDDLVASPILSGRAILAEPIKEIGTGLGLDSATVSRVARRAGQVNKTSPRPK